MLSFIGRLFGKLSIPAILKSFDLDFKTEMQNGVFFAVVAVTIFGRRIYSQRFDLLKLEDALESVVDIDIVQRPAGEFIKIQLFLGGRRLFKKEIQISGDGEPDAKKIPRFTIEEVNRMSTKEIEKMLNEVTVTNK